MRSCTETLVRGAPCRICNWNTIANLCNLQIKLIGFAQAVAHTIAEHSSLKATGVWPPSLCCIFVFTENAFDICKLYFRALQMIDSSPISCDSLPWRQTVCVVLARWRKINGKGFASVCKDFQQKGKVWTEDLVRMKNRFWKLLPAHRAPLSSEQQPPRSTKTALMNLEAEGLTCTWLPPCGPAQVGLIPPASAGLQMIVWSSCAGALTLCMGKEPPHHWGGWEGGYTWGRCSRGPLCPVHGVSPHQARECSPAAWSWGTARGVQLIGEPKVRTEH